MASRDARLDFLGKSRLDFERGASARQNEADRIDEFRDPLNQLLDRQKQGFLLADEMIDLDPMVAQMPIGDLPDLFVVVQNEIIDFALFRFRVGEGGIPHLLRLKRGLIA